MDKQPIYKLQFVLLIALIVMIVGAFSTKSGQGMFADWTRPLFPLAGITLVLVVTYRFGKLFSQADKKPEEKDVFDAMDKNTDPKVLGRLAELKYGKGGRKKNDRIEDYYAIKKP